MKNAYLLALLIMLFNTLTSFSQEVKFYIEGHTLYKSGVARLSVYNSDNMLVPFDSAKIEKGNFLIQGRLDKPTLLLLQFGNESRALFVGNEHITVIQKDCLTKQITVLYKGMDGRESRNKSEGTYTGLRYGEQILDNIHSASHEPE